ncbi:hypothetical protein AQUCO_02200286v1 [Aquilegia coerulea]|uniref:DNA repair metallo-beta-lactamase domain-containing protein n=1 Tax=Aquilegia coerulea TaxID=218851 RepID=A0A2G5DDZ4_AQUCA|nr:hypothetical protein AQUCO_02200286v1 [Aquilegia coerulea]
MPKGLPFSVDTFSPISNRKKHHFLTHAHKDHSVGISTHSFFPIYSTQITKTLILQQFPQLDSSLFVGIEIGETVVIDDLDGTFSVTAFDANHCPEKYIGRKGKKPKYCLDYVFLDCTFGKSFIMIPSKHSAIQQVINCIWKHPEAPMVYMTCDLLAQDELLVEVSRTFGSKVYVDRVNNAECYQALTLTAPEILSEDARSRFQVFEGFVNFYERARTKLTEARANFQPEPLFIRPSAQWYVYDEDSKTGSQRKQMPVRAKKDSFGVWHVCFSSHSSKEELEWALQLLQPKRVVSTTPSCRAMELNYVKKHCLHKEVTSDDPLWKLMEIGVEEGSSSPQVSTFSEICRIQIPIKVMNKRNLSESVRKLYRSMNVLVPRPLPSLVKLMNSNKRAKRSFQF